MQCRETSAALRNEGGAELSSGTLTLTRCVCQWGPPRRGMARLPIRGATMQAHIERPRERAARPPAHTAIERLRCGELRELMASTNVGRLHLF